MINIDIYTDMLCVGLSPIFGKEVRAEAKRQRYEVQGVPHRKWCESFRKEVPTSPRQDGEDLSPVPHQRPHNVSPQPPQWRRNSICCPVS